LRQRLVSIFWWIFIGKVIPDVVMSMLLVYFPIILDYHCWWCTILIVVGLESTKFSVQVHHGGWEVVYYVNDKSTLWFDNVDRLMVLSFRRYATTSLFRVLPVIPAAGVKRGPPSIEVTYKGFSDSGYSMPLFLLVDICIRYLWSLRYKIFILRTP
jgi:hypothetical protein